MNPRQRLVETLCFGKPDRIPLEPGNGRESTLRVWHEQGLPLDGQDPPRYAYLQAGGMEEWPAGGEGFWVKERMIPQFEEKVIEQRANSQIVQDWKGNICEIGKEFTVGYLREARDFVTRRWIKCPVESRADWDHMKWRYNPDDPSRLPSDAQALGRRLVGRTWPITFNFSGPFWQLREWLGFENLCTMFHDDPDFVREMVGFWEEYVARLMERAFRCLVPDVVHISEDMAYKGFSMISPFMTREFLLPTYRRWGELIRGAGCPLYAVDSDGFVGELIPIWLEAGIRVCDPMEVAAGNDIVALRKEFGRKMAFRGGVDKRAMAKGGKAIEEEIRRITPVVKSGGYIPGCDHAVPPDVSWPDYVRYVGLLARLTGWLQDGGR